MNLQRQELISKSLSKILADNLTVEDMAKISGGKSHVPAYNLVTRRSMVTKKNENMVLECLKYALKKNIKLLSTTDRNIEKIKNQIDLLK